jgi:hypothetical protein
VASDDVPATRPDADLRRDAMGLLNAHIQAYERYHAHKEQMAWLATAAYLGGAALIVGRRPPFWQYWAPVEFGAWFALRSLSIGMRQGVHELSVGAPPGSLGLWVD